MNFLAKLRLCAILWCSRTPADWRWLRDYCQREAFAAARQQVLDELQRIDAHKATAAQLLAGTRTTGAAERLLHQARALAASPPPTRPG